MRNSQQRGKDLPYWSQRSPGRCTACQHPPQDPHKFKDRLTKVLALPEPSEYILRVLSQCLSHEIAMVFPVFPSPSAAPSSSSIGLILKLRIVTRRPMDGCELNIAVRRQKEDMRFDWMTAATEAVSRKLQLVIQQYSLGTRDESNQNLVYPG